MQAISEEDAVEAAPDVHRVIFESNNVRILAVTLQPSGKAAMHWHPENVFYPTSSGKMKVTKEDGSTVEVTLIEGKEAINKEGSHAVENIGNSDITGIQIELAGTE